MRNQVLYSMLGMAVLFLVNGCQKPVQPDPTLELSQTEVAVPAEGGTYSVAFKVTNPKDGAEVTVAAPEVDWVTNVVVGESDITFDVAKNETTEARTAKVAVSYPGIEPDAEFTISQEAGEPAPFVITVKNITETTATYDIIPNDPKMTYVCFATSQEYIDFNGLTTDDALYADDMEYIDSQIAYGYSFEDFTATGELIDSPVSGMMPNSEYVVYAYGVNPDTHARLTDIVYARFTTLAVEMIDASFSFSEPEVNGPVVTVTVTPDNYDGYWTAYAFETSSLDSETSLYDLCNENWSSILSIFQMFGYTAEETLEMNCLKGEQTISFELNPSTSYTLAAFAVNDKALAASDPSSLEVTTGAVEPSDNVITIEVSDITGTSAMVSFIPSNDDPYAFDVWPSEYFEGLSDSEILNMCASSSPNETSGYFSSKLSGVEPQTSYTAVAFGYQAGVPTTDLFKYTFTTADPVTGPIDFELKFDAYYDASATADALRSAGYTNDAEYFDSMVEAGIDALMPVEAVTTPKVGTFYYAIFEDVEGNHTDDPNEYITYLQYYGSSSDSAYYSLNYDMPLFAVGVAFDDNGEPGPVWVSEPFTLTKDGVSDPQDFVDYLYPSSSTTTTSLKAFAASKDNRSLTSMNSASRVERFTPSAAPAKIAASNKGGEVICVRPVNFKTPDFTGKEAHINSRLCGIRK